MKKSKQIIVPDCDDTEYEVTPENRVTIENAINDYAQIVNNLETSVQDLSKALTPVLIEEQKPIVIPTKSQACIASLRCKDILALNDTLRKIQITIHMLQSNLGV